MVPDYFRYFFFDGIGTLVLLTGAVAALSLFRWAGQHHTRVCQQRGTVLAGCGLTGQLVAQRLLALAGLSQVPVLRSTRLNYYHPWRRHIRLNTVTFDSSSLLAVTTAAHEVGHAQQFAERILLCRLRAIFWPLCYLFIALAVVLPVLQVADVIALPLDNFPAFVLGLGVVVALLQLPITLPLEHDASRRARQLAQEARLIGPGEQSAFDAMLKSAWLTHAAHQAQGYVYLAAAGVALFFFPAFLEPPREADDHGVGQVANAIQELPVSPTPIKNTAPTGPQPAPISTGLPYSDDLAGEFGPFDSLYLLFSAVVGIVPCLVIYFLLTKLTPGGRRGKSAAESAIERNNAAQILFEKGAFQAARAAYDEALRLDPTLAAAYFNRGQTNIRLGKLDEALTDIETNLRLTPNYAYAIAARGDVWAMRGDLDRTLAEYDEALRLAPENAHLLTRRGLIRLNKGDHNQAIADFTAALNRDPTQAAAWRDRGLAWYWQNEPGRAIADLDEAIRLVPTDAAAFNNRGAAYLKAGNYSQASADLQEAIRLDPTFPNPHRHLAWLQATCPQPEFRNGAAAVASATRALDLAGGKPGQGCATLAAAYAEAGNFDDAVKWQTKCLDESPPDARAEVQARLELYEAREAFRDQIASGPPGTKSTS